MFIDTQVEKDIELGSRYKFDPMSEAQCLVNQQMADSLNLEEGFIMYVKVDMYQNLIALIDKYNEDVAKPKGYPVISRDVILEGDTSVVTLPCRVAHIGDQSYGKMPKAAAPE